MSYRNEQRWAERFRRLADRVPNHYNGTSYLPGSDLLADLKNSDGLVVTRGIFSLPLLAMDAPHGRDGCSLEDVPQPFIAGPENELLRVYFDALSAATSSFNPITLYGSSGVGKSHLLQGAISHLRSQMPDRKIYALSGADFARSYANAVELDTLAESRERFVAADVFIVDGLQEFATKPSVQRELMNVVDIALERQSLLLFSCSSGPADWTWMIPALRSRLTGGLIIPVVSPHVPTRLEMVRQMASAFQLELTDAAIRRLATGQSVANSKSVANLQSGPFAGPNTYPKLRGSLLQLANETRVLDSPHLQPMSIPTESTPAQSNDDSTRYIAKLVAQQFGVKLSDLLGSSRRHSVVRARGVAMYLARSLLALSYEQLGRAFGGRDHTTVLHAYRTITTALATDHTLKQTVDKLASQLAVVPSTA